MVKGGDYKSFAEFFKALRKDKRITLRDFCLKAGADPGNISKLERGAMKPPQDPEILERYAKTIGLEIGSDNWYTFMDLAAADKGIIPQDLMSDAELVGMLPVFFRTLRGQKPSKKDMEMIVEKLKKS